MHVIDRENAGKWVDTLRRIIRLHSGALLQPHERMTDREMRDTRNTVARVQAALDRGDERITVQDDGSVPYERVAEPVCVDRDHYGPVVTGPHRGCTFHGGPAPTCAATSEDKEHDR